LNADTDNDGIPDGEDSDPLVPLDTDGDGVVDASDLCSGTSPIDFADVVDEEGCGLSQLDADEDGLSNYEETAHFVKLTASDAEENDYFGVTVAIDGDLAVVGAYFDDDGENEAGAVYVYRYNGSDWQEETKLVAADARASAYFGYSVAVQDNLIVVGAVNDDENGSDAGAAYVYRYDEAMLTWTQEAKLIGSGVASAFFGQSVAIDRDLIVVGALNESPSSANSGAASIYRWDESSSSWAQEAQLVPSDGAAGDEFGISVSVSGEVIIVGADRDDDGGSTSGAAYVYRLVESSWQETKLTASDAAEEDMFGISVSISGDVAAVGAYSKDVSGVDSGAVYVYQWDGATWNEEILTASDAAEGDIFGYSVSVSGERIVVVSISDDENGSNSGSVYTYRENDSVWSEYKITPSDGAAGDAFGNPVFVSDNLLIAGASQNDDRGSQAGAAYIYDLSQMTDPNNADTDDDGVSDGDEITEGSDPNDSSSTACVEPDSGDWTVTRDCTLFSSKTWSGDFYVQNGAVVTIPSGITLDLDFATHKLTVESGSGVLIEQGATLH
jgi:hypothetical protein